MDVEAIDINPDKAAEVAPLETNLLTWMAVHGNLCLALRHPQNRGPSRSVILEFLTDLSNLIVERGLLTREQMDAAFALEREVAGALGRSS